MTLTPTPRHLFYPIDDSSYSLTIPDKGVELHLRYAHREKHELHGELTVECTWPGAKTHNGTLYQGNFNISSARSRAEMAKHCHARSKVLEAEFDWLGFIEEFAQRIARAERAGQPLVDLADTPDPGPEPVYTIDGLPLLQQHPTILFGDGGTGKSYLALHFSAILARQNIPVLYVDWELDAASHARRLRELAPIAPAGLLYLRAQIPLVRMIESLRTHCRERAIRFVVFDSISFGCDGPPEGAETAAAYMRAVRSLGVGSLLLAHRSKAEEGDQKPFGSAMWWNAARAVYFLAGGEVEDQGDTVEVIAQSRKQNLGRRPAPVAWRLRWVNNRVTLIVINPSDSPALTESLSLTARVRLYLQKQGPADFKQIAEDIAASENSVRQAVGRYEGRLFEVIDGGKFRKKVLLRP